jgi:hypothetical protein
MALYRTVWKARWNVGERTDNSRDRALDRPSTKLGKEIDVSYRRLITGSPDGVPGPLRYQ